MARILAAAVAAGVAAGVLALAPAAEGAPAGAGSAGAGAGAAGTEPALRALHATTGPGARIVDDQGRTVLLRGVNLNGLGDYHQEAADLPATLPLTEADLAAIAAHGFDVVRLILSWSALEPTPGEIDAAALHRIGEVLGWARAHGVHVLLDMHQDAWGKAVVTPDGVTCPPPLEPAVGWDGAPAWATLLVGTAATCRLGQRELSVAVQASFSAFFADVGGVQGHLVDTWAAVARRFAPDPTVAGYDLLNEPNPGLAAGADDLVLLGTFYARALGAIRAAEAAAGAAAPGRIGFFEPSVLTGPLATPGPLPGLVAEGNVVYAPHLYQESISILPGTIEEGFANAATAAATYGTTFFSGEWGWFGDPVADQPKLERYAAQEDAHLVGGTWWQWAQACGDPHAVPARHQRPACAGRSPLSDGLVTRPPANVAVLTRAYPRAAPGVLRSLHADVASGALEVTGTAERPGTAADLWVPERCGDPTVTGTAIGPTTRRRVPGGWRVTVPVPAPRDYRIAVACPGRAGATPEGAGGTAAGRRDGAGGAPAGPGDAGRLPATGARPSALAALLLLALAALARSVARFVARR